MNHSRDVALIKRLGRGNLPNIPPVAGCEACEDNLAFGCDRACIACRRAAIGSPKYMEG
jgi:hypothetical protein